MFKITFSTAVKYKENYYLVGQNVSGLFMFSEKKKKIEYLFPFLGEKQYRFQYNLSFLHKNKAWFIPHWADRIAIVDLDNLSVEYLDLEYHDIFFQTYVKFINYLIIDNHYVLLVPQDVDIAVMIDLETYEKTVFSGMASIDKNFSSAVCHDGMISFYPWKGDFLVQLNSKTGEKREYPWKKGNHLYGDTAVDYKTTRIIHAPFMGKGILIENEVDSTYKMVAVEGDCDNSFYYITRYEGYFLIWGSKRNSVLRMDMDYQINEYKIKKSENEFLFPIRSDDISDGSEALLFGGNKIIKYKGDTIVETDIDISSDYIKGIVEKTGYGMWDLFGGMESHVLCCENSEFGLDQFLSAI